MANSDTGERVTAVLDFPSRDALFVHADRVYVTIGFVLGDGENPTVEAA